MFNGNNGYSLSDFAALMGNNRNNDGFGDGFGCWWIIILFLFFMNGGWGDWGNNGRGSAATTGFVAAQDALTRADLCSEFGFQNLDRSIGSIGKDVTSGFTQTNNAITGGNYDILSAINNNTVANMQNTNSLTAQLNNMAATNASCCQNLMVA